MFQIKTSPVTQHAVALMQHRTTHHLANTHCTVAQPHLYHSRLRAKISTFIVLFSYDCNVNMWRLYFTFYICKNVSLYEPLENAKKLISVRTFLRVKWSYFWGHNDHGASLKLSYNKYKTCYYHNSEQFDFSNIRYKWWTTMSKSSPGYELGWYRIKIDHVIKKGIWFFLALLLHCIKKWGNSI